jgi:hypothetical protein
MTGSPASRRPERGEELAWAFDEWRQAPVRHHLAVLLLLVVVVAARYPAGVFSPGLDDELAYVRGFYLAGQDVSPYKAPYFYTPTFAYAGAWMMRHLGETATIVAIRAANLFGLAALAWCSFAWVPWPWRRRVVASAAVICVSPAVRLGVLWGNLSLLVAGMLVVGLLLWRRRPLVSGFLLALSVVIKPLGPVAVCVLGAHRPDAGGRRHVVAAALAAALTAVLLLPAPFLGEMLSFKGKLGSGRNVSLQRLFYSFGVEVSPWWIAAAVAVAAVAVARRRPLGVTRLLCLAASAALLSTPILWSHTMLLALPLEVVAATVAWYRRPVRRDDSPSGVVRRYEFVLVLLLGLAMHFCEGMGGGLEGGPLWRQGVAISIPALAPAVLTAYILRTKVRLDPPAHGRRVPVRGGRGSAAGLEGKGEQG